MEMRCKHKESYLKKEKKHKHLSFVLNSGLDADLGYSK